jgi:pyrroline-5-carboxylate reductase
MKKRKVCVVGGGQMGRALVGGMLSADVVSASQVAIVDPSAESRNWWAQQHPDIQVCSELEGSALDAEVFLLAVKPYLISEVAEALKQRGVGERLVVSIAAGVPLATICEAVGHQRVIRVMPNTPSLVGAGASAFCAAGAVQREDSQWLRVALSAVGVAVEVSESQMDAVTGLSGSGPAYICLVIEALADGGVLAGLPRPLAMQLATQTVLGTAKMVAETGKHPGELKDAVASPGGTTIAALRTLEEHGIRAALINAVEASARRSREL